MKFFGIFGLFTLALISQTLFGQCQAHPFRSSQKSFPSDEVWTSARNNCGIDEKCIDDFIAVHWYGVDPKP